MSELQFDVKYVLCMFYQCLVSVFMCTLTYNWCTVSDFFIH